MAYSGIASTIDGYRGTLSSGVNNLDQIDLDSSWEGSAHSKQKTNLDDIVTAYGTQFTQLESLTSAMVKIDEYDEAESNYNSASASRDSLDSKADNYKSLYDDYSATMTDCSDKMSTLEGEINTLLDSITDEYSSKINVIDATELESTTDYFVNIETISSKFGSAFDLSNTVVINKNYLADPDFTNSAAWVTENPYAQSGLYGQCTWYAWGKFYEIYGYSPGFTGNGRDCVSQLLAAHPDKFTSSSTPVAGSVFSNSGSGTVYGHVGMVLAVDGDNITITEGNLNGKTDSFAVAQTDWVTHTVNRQQWEASHAYTYYANPV